MPSPDSATPPNAAAWLARAQSLAEQATPAALAEAVRASDQARASGLLAARAQDLPFEEALLLRVGSTLDAARGRDRGW